MIQRVEMRDRVGVYVTRKESNNFPVMSDQSISSDMSLGIEIILTLSVRVSLFSGREGGRHYRIRTHVIEC